MTEKTVAEKAVDADLECPRFRAGAARGQWRKVSYKFPVLIMAVSAVDLQGKRCEFYFHFELSNFPGVAPEVKIWDLDAGALLPDARRPKGSPRVIEAFKSWGSGTVYRPWDRHGLGHNEWASKHPELAWHAKRDLSFILEDLHGLLNPGPSTSGGRPAA